MQIDLRVTELLASKLCHDLVSPVSAINNGVELIEDIGGSVVDEAMKLIGNSATQAARRLRLYRIAYGRAGSEETLAVKEVRSIAEQYLSGGKVSLTWPDAQPEPALAEARGYLKTILNLVVLSEEVLAYGGAVTLSNIKRDGKDACQLQIVGRNAQLTPLLQGALEATTTVEELTPRSIQAYYCGQLAKHFNLALTFDQSIPDRLDLMLAMGEKIAAEPPTVAVEEMPAEMLLASGLS